MPKRHDIAILHSSKRSDWRTPPELYAALDAEFDFGLDVAATEANSLCDTWLGPDQDPPWHDAREVDWHTLTSAAFMNPPYCKGDKNADPPIEPMPIEPWIEKAWEESLSGCTVVGVVPFSPQTSWFKQYVFGQAQVETHAAHELRILPHRVSFVNPDTGVAGANANVNTCIVVWKPNPGYVGLWQPAIRYWSYRS